MDPTTTRGHWTIDNRTGVIGHATRDFGIDLARCDTRAAILAKLAYAFTKPWITDTERHDLVLLMAEACGVRPDDSLEAPYAADAPSEALPVQGREADRP